MFYFCVKHLHLISLINIRIVELNLIHIPPHSYQPPPYKKNPCPRGLRNGLQSFFLQPNVKI